MSQPLTKRQKELLDFIRRFSSKHGFSPTYEEMASALGVSSLSTIHDHLEQLVKKWFIKIYRGSVRGIEIIKDDLKKDFNQVDLPLLGFIAAGKPIEAITQSETISIPASLLKARKKAFVLKVRGDSMVEEGILDGDYVVVEEQAQASNGDIVVALIDGAFATLKKFYREKNRIRLEPANAKMKPIYAKNVVIQGKVRGVVRAF